jgi:hypothetical protein
MIALAFPQAPAGREDVLPYILQLAKLVSVHKL